MYVVLLWALSTPRTLMAIGATRELSHTKQLQIIKIIMFKFQNWRCDAKYYEWSKWMTYFSTLSDYIDPPKDNNSLSLPLIRERRSNNIQVYLSSIQHRNWTQAIDLWFDSSQKTLTRLIMVSNDLEVTTSCVYTIYMLLLLFWMNERYTIISSPQKTMYILWAGHPISP